MANPFNKIIQNGVEYEVSHKPVLLYTAKGSSSKTIKNLLDELKPIIAAVPLASRVNLKLIDKYTPSYAPTGVRTVYNVRTIESEDIEFSCCITSYTGTASIDIRTIVISTMSSATGKYRSYYSSGSWGGSNSTSDTTANEDLELYLC